MYLDLCLYCFPFSDGFCGCALGRLSSHKDSQLICLLGIAGFFLLSRTSLGHKSFTLTVHHSLSTWLSQYQLLQRFKQQLHSLMHGEPRIAGGSDASGGKGCFAEDEGLDESGEEAILCVELVLCCVSSQT